MKTRKVRIGNVEYEVEDDVFERTVNISFIGTSFGDTKGRNETFSAKNLLAIFDKEFSNVPRKKIRISAHGACGINISYKKR